MEELHGTDRTSLSSNNVAETISGVNICLKLNHASFFYQLSRSSLADAPQYYK